MIRERQASQRGSATRRSLGPQKRVLILMGVLALTVAIVIPARAYNTIDNWGENFWWNDPSGGGGLALLADTYYNYPGTGDHNYYNTAEQFDNICGCFTYVAAKSFMTDGDWFPWYETAWDIDPDYANATIARTDGLHVEGKYQAYPYSGWTTYFEYSPILPN